MELEFYHLLLDFAYRSWGFLRLTPKCQHKTGFNPVLATISFDCPSQPVTKEISQDMLPWPQKLQIQCYHASARHRLKIICQNVER